MCNSYTPRSENFDWVLQWWSVKIIFRTTNTIVSKWLLRNYILYSRDLIYIWSFPLYIGIPLIFTDFLQCTWCPLCVGEIVNIRAILRCTGRSHTQCSSLDIKYVWTILRQIYFLKDHHCKTHLELSEMLKNSPNLLSFLHGVTKLFTIL